MRKSNLTVHREMFRDTCLKANTSPEMQEGLLFKKDIRNRT